MAQPATGPASTEGPCSDPAGAPVHPVDVVLVVMTESSAGTLALGEIRGRRTDGRTLRAGTSAGALVAVLLDLFFHHLGTRSRHQAPALKSS